MMQLLFIISLTAQMCCGLRLPSTPSDTPDIHFDMLTDELAELGLELPSFDSYVAKGTPLDHVGPYAHRPVMWVHISKAGGSTMCSLANQQEHVVTPNIQCNWKGHDQAKLVNSGSHGDCEQRASYFQQNNFTWGQIERELNDEDLCFRDFDYGTIIRDPIELAESLLNFFEIGPDAVDEYMHCVESRGQGNSCDGLQTAHTHTSIHTPPWYFMDNYLLRILGGKDMYNLPVGNLTAQHAEAVLEKLTKFKAVLIFDDLKDNVVFENLFGWSALPTETLVNQNEHKVRFTTEQRKTLREVMAPDYKVYDYFSHLKFTERASSFVLSPT